MSDAEPNVSQLPWQLDKRVPLALILAILAQTAGGAWYAAKQDARVEVLESKTRYLVDTERTTQRSISEIREVLAATKPTIDGMAKALERIERQLDGGRK